MNGNDRNPNRAGFFRAGAAGLAGAALFDAFPGAAWAAGGGAPARSAHTPDEALALLKAGNARFVSGNTRCGPLTARRVELASGQSPIVVLLSCADSRVPLDTVFDQVPGEIFGMRVAGNFLEPFLLGSAEYGVAVLGAPLILVLGHSSCGAVQSTVGYVKDGKPLPGHIQEVVDKIVPAAKASKGQPGDWVVNATAENVRMNAAAFAPQSKIIADAVSSGKVKVVGGVYDLHSGKVNLLT